jgi:hypothetical protein
MFLVRPLDYGGAERHLFELILRVPPFFDIFEG